jgi:hypothetical protein
LFRHFLSGLVYALPPGDAHPCPHWPIHQERRGDSLRLYLDVLSWRCARSFGMESKNPLRWRDDFFHDDLRSLHADFGQRDRELLLGKNGYVRPTSDDSTIVQNQSLQIVFDALAVGVEAISSIIIVILMSFLNVEKNLANEQAEIQTRRKEAVLAAGGVWVSPEEKSRQEEEEYERLSQENDLSALKKKCERHHLDYEAEKTKYEAKKAEKAAKKKA